MGELTDALTSEKNGGRPGRQNWSLIDKHVKELAEGLGLSDAPEATTSQNEYQHGTQQEALPKDSTAKTPASSSSEQNVARKNDTRKITMEYKNVTLCCPYCGSRDFAIREYNCVCSDCSSVFLTPDREYSNAVMGVRAANLLVWFGGPVLYCFIAIIVGVLLTGKSEAHLLLLLIPITVFYIVALAKLRKKIVNKQFKRYEELVARMKSFETR